MSKGIVLAGNMIVDITYPIERYPAESQLTTLTEGIERSIGGLVCNVITDLAKLDDTLPLQAIGLIGDDSEGDLIEEQLGRMKNVDLSQVVRTGRSSITIVMSSKENKKRTFFQYRGNNACFDESYINWDSIRGDILHVGYILLLDALDEEDDDIVEVIRVPVDEPEDTEEILQEEEIGTQEEIEEPIAELISEEQEEPIPEQEPVAEEEHIEVSATAAREAMEDEVAIASVTESGEVSDKSKPVVVNVDTLSKYFRNGDRVTLKEMKESIPFVPNRATYVKVLARGRINKSLEVEADDFSLDAVKMIVLAGGKVIRKRTN